MSSGTKCIDTNTGLIYFKYDFGYEFGILFPGEGRKYIAVGNKCSMPALPTSKHFLHNSAGAIDIPVLHEQKIKQKLCKQRNKNDVYDFTRENDRRNLIGNKQPTVTFNIDELHIEPARIGQLSQEGAFFIQLSICLIEQIIRCCLKYVVAIHASMLCTDKQKAIASNLN